MKNRDVISAAVGIAAAFVLCMGAPSMSVKADTPLNGWYEENGAKYWYENGVRQGTEGRGKEIYDPGSDAWYWLDARMCIRNRTAENGYAMMRTVT